MEKYKKLLLFIILIPIPDFPLFLLYVKCKSGLTFVRRCFRDVLRHLLVYSCINLLRSTSGENFCAILVSVVFMVSLPSSAVLVQVQFFLHRLTSQIYH